MTAYMIAQVDVTDAEKFDAYRALGPGTLEKYGGKYIVRGGDMALLEGDTPYPRVVIIAFPDLDAIRRWHASEEYAEPLAMRQASSNSVLIGIDGYDG